MKPILVMLTKPDKTLHRCLANIYTALTGRLTVIIERDGETLALITEIPVDVPPSVRRTAQIAAAIPDFTVPMLAKPLPEVSIPSTKVSDEA